MFTFTPAEAGTFSTLVARAQRPHISYYEYDPSQALSIVATVLYGITAAAHVFQMIRYRSWYLSVLVLAALMEVLGYFSRILSDHNVYSRPLYIMQFTLVVLAPVFIAASDYVLFGKLLESVLPGGRRAKALGVSARFVTYIFISGDILSFVLQGIGAGFMTGSSESGDIEKLNLGRDLMLAGLGTQILTFGFFICATIRFDVKGRALEPRGGPRPKWRVLLWALYFSSLLIMARSCYRVAEFSQGWKGYLASHEVYFYCLEALPMLPCFIVFNIFHPARYLLSERKDSPASSIEEGQEEK